MRKTLLLSLALIACGILNAQARVSVTSTYPTMEVNIVADKSMNFARHISSPESTQDGGWCTKVYLRPAMYEHRELVDPADLLTVRTRLLDVQTGEVFVYPEEL